MRCCALLLMGLLLLGGCGLFEVRDSEPPTKPPLWNDIPTTWELCMQNLQYCYEDERNVVKYSGIFSPEYRFYFSAQDINDFGINLDWLRPQEQDMLLILHSQCDSLNLALELLPGQGDEITSNLAKIYRKYTLDVYRNGNPFPTQHIGNLELHFRKENGYWYVWKWYDYRSYTAPTWGKLKYDYAQ